MSFSLFTWQPFSSKKDDLEGQPLTRAKSMQPDKSALMYALWIAVLKQFISHQEQSRWTNNDVFTFYMADVLRQEG
jgi:hypothetical protein